MKTVTLRELHARTGEWVREASRCGQIVVTDNGRPIARIVPEPEEAGLPYFADRKASEAFRRFDQSGKAGLGPDVTRIISEDREDPA
ncbi:MAG: type II toxin-antitoxin system prevent-host-death family antitoxin [Verrucomicrobiae bacterium]|nr:type II toxin-antitoxin system prevent-host-death family antitoxin [Verrucomicrobiae bacterium]